jgi:oligopeptide/dipeptide ABC transporter ATP-binding protein
MSSAGLLQVDGLSKHFRAGRGTLVRAVDGVSFAVDRGETLGLVGESGSGKSTIANSVLGLTALDSGTIAFEGRALAGLSRDELRAVRRSLTAVFQDPSGSLNRRRTAGAIVGAPLVAHGIGSAKERRARVVEMLELVGLGSEFLRRRPSEMSGGQCQRVAIARALATGPSLVVLDEAVSSLDVSIQAQVLNLLRQLQRENDLAYLFISHDLAVVRFLCSRVAVMYRGRIVETGPREVLFSRPLHPYTHSLMRAIPVVDPVRARELISVTPAQDAIDMPTPAGGCRFRTLCPVGRDQELCRTVDPELRAIEANHATACHFPQVAGTVFEPAGTAGATPPGAGQTGSSPPVGP